MILLAKRVLRPGRLPNCTDFAHDRPTALVFSVRTLRRWEQEHYKLLDSGLVRPIYLDHPLPASKSEPTSKREFLLRRRNDKTLVGYVHNFRVASDGSSGIVSLAILDKATARKAIRNEFELSPRIDVKFVDGKRCLTLLSFDFVGKGEAADKSQSPFRRLSTLTPTLNGATSMNLSTTESALDVTRLSDREVNLLRRIRETIAEIGHTTPDAFNVALRVLWPSQASEILGEGDSDEVRRIDQQGVAFSLERPPAHSYASGDCSPEQAKAEVAEFKKRHSHMLR